MGKLFVLQNYAVFTMAVVMIIIALQHFKAKRFLSICVFGIMGMVLVLSALITLEYYAKFEMSSPMYATLCTFFGYAIRPFCLYSFLLLAKRKFEKIDYFVAIPLVLNVFIYASSLFLNVPFLKTLTFYYELNEAGTEWIHVRGPMNFTSHIIGALGLIYLIYLSVIQLRGKHRSDAYSVLICAAFIVGAVIVEMFDFSIGLLNITIAASCIFYYLFLLKEENRKDGLTGLFDRKTFYADLEKYGKSVNAAIAIDMNGLKSINDKLGHEAGDKAIVAVSEAILSQCKRNYYLYRMGGDEFTVLLLNAKEEEVVSFASRVKAKVEGTGLTCSIGYCYSANKMDVTSMLKEADEAMYKDKMEFYKSHPELSRRSSDKASS